MIRIRKYNDEDYMSICEIHDAARLNELKAANLEAAFIPLEIAAVEEVLFDYQLYIAEKDKDVVGFVAYHDHDLAWLYVDPQVGRSGIGKTLVNHVKKTYKGEPITLEVISDNKLARTFYDKMGFRKSGSATGAMPGNESFIIDVTEMIFEPEIKRLKEFSETDLNDTLETWKSAVRATHHFLDEADIQNLKPQVLEGVQAVDEFYVIRNDGNKIFAFLGCHEEKIEMLFVDHKMRGQGSGKNLFNSR